MITLARHIELLLLEHDCVIVPGLGGFIANHADARYCKDGENLFLPPYRTIGFNQQLQVNDGLLVQSYMAAYDTSYPFASLQMEKDLEKMMYELEMTGEYTLENIGILRKGINQNITFTAPETGALTPALYGLYSYEMPSLQNAVKKKEIEKNMQAAAAMSIATTSSQEKQEKPQPKHKDIVIRLNRHWLDFGISAAAAILLFFCFSYPAMKNANSETDTVVATFTPMGDVTATTKVLNAKPSTPKKETSTSTVNAEQPKPAVKSNTPPTTSPEQTSKQAEEPKYAIVLASYVNQVNAENLIRELAEAGFPEGRYTKTGKVSRILYSGYPDETSAQNALKSLREESIAFDEAWILALQQ